MAKNTLEMFGLASATRDPITGHEQALGFRGWGPVVQDFARWKREAPGMLANAIEWRRELLEAGPTRDPGDWDRRSAELRAGLELAQAVHAGVLP